MANPSLAKNGRNRATPTAVSSANRRPISRHGGAPASAGSESAGKVPSTNNGASTSGAILKLMAAASTVSGAQWGRFRTSSSTAPNSSTPSSRSKRSYRSGNSRSPPAQ